MNWPICPRCGNDMRYGGGGFSGSRYCQNYKCNKCGKTWLNTKELYTPKK